MAGLAEFYNTKMLLSQCIEYVLKEEVTMKEKEKEIENLNLKIAYGDDNGDFIFNSMDNDYTTDDDDRSWDV